MKSSVMALISLLLVLAYAEYAFGSLPCHEEYEINNETKCERDFNIERHELVGLLRTVEDVTYVCRTYPQYEECLKGLIAGCPKYQSFMDLRAYDQESTNIAFKGFCDDQEVYLRAVPCFTPSFPHILKCFDGHGKALKRAIDVVEATNDWDQYYDTLCPFQSEGAHCIASAVGNCSAEAKQMMKNVAFSLVHGRCKDVKKYGWYRSDYDKKYGSSAVTVALSSFLSAVAVISVSLWM